MTPTAKNWISTALFTAIVPTLLYVANHAPPLDTWAAWRPILITAAGTFVACVWHSYQESSSSGGLAAKLKAGALKFVGSLLALVVTAAALAGCISSAPTVPETPANQAQISSCEGTASLHNGVVVGDFVLGGGGTAVAGIAAGVSDTTAKNDLAIAGAIIGGGVVVGTALAAYTASNFANSQCSTVVGSLPSVAHPAPTPAGN